MADVDTLVLGAGQAGLATSYWLSAAGVEHTLLDRRDTIGGSWLDRWDSFRLNTPSFTLTLPGAAHDGTDPDGFLSAPQMVAFLRRYAADIAAPVQLGTTVRRVREGRDGFVVSTDRGDYAAANVVLATGAYPRPHVPAAAAGLSPQLVHLHSQDYRSPDALPEGGVLVVGSGQSGGQIAEELVAAGRATHLAMSACPESPRRYRGRDISYWLMQLGLHGPEHGMPTPTVEQLPSPAARLGCNAVLSGVNGGHEICLRELAQAGVRLHGHLEGGDADTIGFRDDVEQLLAANEGHFATRVQPVVDRYIAAAGLDAPPDDRTPHSSYVPATASRLSPRDERVSTIVWATGYRLDFSWLDLPVLDEWGYPRHRGGVTDQPGLYAVGLPWLTNPASALVAGVGQDAARIAEHIATRDRQGSPDRTSTSPSLTGGVPRQS